MTFWQTVGLLVSIPAVAAFGLIGFTFGIVSGSRSEIRTWARAQRDRAAGQ